LPVRADIVTCSLFLHHLDPPDVVRTLSRCASAAGRRLLVHDLVRTRTGLALVYVIPRVVTTSPVVHTDAVLSVRAAYTRDELADLARSAGLQGFELRPSFPQRMLLSWSPR
jgi:hypothetical protein